MILAPSILAADFARLGEELGAVEAAAAALGQEAWAHVDVMDGHFVPNLTFGPPLIEKWKPHSNLPFDVHLMIANAEETVDDYIKAGADLVTVHVEAVKHPQALFEKIRLQGKRAGISLKPGTPVENIKHLVPHVDLVLVMTVEPGFGGQSFMHGQLDKVRQVKDWDKTGKVLVSVDGGVNDKTIAATKEAGTDVFVAGSAVFKGSDYQQTMKDLINAANGTGD